MAPQWRVWDGYRGRLFMREIIHGVPVLRTCAYVPKDPRKAWKRVIFDSSFAVSALAGFLVQGDLDLLVVISPPLQLALTGLVIGRLRRAPVFLHTKDLVADAAVATGALDATTPAVRAAYALERWVYRKCTAIGVICEGMKRNLEGKGVPPEKIAVLPDYVDLTFIRPLARENEFRRRFAIGSDSFVAMYSGSVGGKQGLETFVRAAHELQQDGDILCCLIGEGPYLPNLQDLARRLGASRLRFLPIQPRESLAEQLSAADVLVITQRRNVREAVFPGKLLYYMAAGRPILAAVHPESETGRFVRHRDVGIVVPPEEPYALAQAIRFFAKNRIEARRLGENARKVAESEFDRRIILDKFAVHLQKLARECQ